VTLGLAVGHGDAAFGDGLADFGADLIGGYRAGGTGVDPMRCLASAAPEAGPALRTQTNSSDTERDPDRASVPHGEP